MRWMVRDLGCGAVALALSGCWWPMPGSTPGRQAHNPAEQLLTTATVSDLGQLWTATTTTGPVGDPVTSPAGVLVHDDAALHSFTPTTGAEQWTHPWPGQAYVTGDEVWARGPGGSTVVLSAATGTPLRAVVADQAVSAMGDDHVVTTCRCSIATMVDVLDRSTGTWVCCGTLLFGPGQTEPVPTTVGAGGFFHAGNGLVDAVSDDVGNALRWYRIDPPLPCSWFPGGMCPSRVTRLDGTDATRPVVSADGATVYVGTDVGTVYGVDAGTGAIEWSTGVGSAVVDSPALANGHLYVPTEGDGLVVLDAATGASTWTGGTDGGAVTEQPAVAGDVVYVGTADGGVLAFDAGGCGTGTCSPLWSDGLGSDITGAPAVSNGQLFVGTADGRLVAYGLG